MEVESFHVGASSCPALTAAWPDSRRAVLITGEHDSAATHMDSNVSAPSNTWAPRCPGMLRLVAGGG